MNFSIKSLFTGNFHIANVRRRMIGAAIIISVGFGFSFFTLYLVHSRTEHLSAASKDALRGLAAISKLNFEIKALMLQQTDAIVLKKTLEKSIEQCDKYITLITESTIPFASDLADNQIQIQKLWDELKKNLDVAATYLDHAAQVEGHKELVIHGIRDYVNHFDPKSKGAIGDPHLFSHLRDFTEQITIIEHTANLFLKHFYQFSNALDTRHLFFLKISYLISITIYVIMTSFTIVFLTLFSGSLTKKLKTMVGQIVERNKSLKQRSEELRAIMSAIPDQVYGVKRDGKFFELFAANQDLTIKSKQVMTGKSLIELLPAGDAHNFQLAIEKTLVTHSLQNIDYQLDVDGKLYYFTTSLVPFLYQNESAILCVTRDISERKLAEMEQENIKSKVFQSQKMVAIGQLASGIAHDFNNMLAGIIGAAELLKTEVMNDRNSSDNISLILHSAERAAELSKNLLLFSRQQQLETSHIDIHEIIENASKLLRKTVDKRISIETILLAEQTTILGASTQLINVFINLGINSAHAMPNGGTLSFQTRYLKLDKAFCENNSFSLTPGDFLEVLIKDEGSGIAPSDLPRIFEPFFSTKEIGKGTGLGLSVAYGTICQHHGSITVESKLSIGTTFTILLPLTQMKPTQLVDKKEIVFGKGSVLLVDDEAVLRITGEKVLKKLGYDVLLAENGEKAIEVFKQNIDSINIVILDMIMPIMNGRECFLALRSLRPDIKVIVASGFADNEDLTLLKRMGISGILDKPYNSVALSNLLADALSHI